MLHPPDLSQFQFGYLLAALAVSSLGSLGATRLQKRCAQAPLAAPGDKPALLLGAAGLGLCTWLAYLLCRLALDVALPLAGNAGYYAVTLLLCLTLSSWTVLRLRPRARQRRRLLGAELLFAAGCVVCDGVGYALTYPHYAQWKYALVASTITCISGTRLVATRLAFRRQELRGAAPRPLALAAGSVLSGIAAVLLPMLTALALSVAQPLLFAAVTPGLVYMLGFTIVLSGLLVALHLLETSIERQCLAAEEAALQEETHYDVLYERNPDAVFRLDLMIRFTHVNPAMNTLSGYDADELIGRSLIGCISPSEVELTLQQLYQALKGQACSFATALLTRSGQTRGMLMTAIPIAPDGRTVGIFVMAKDVHDSKKAFHEYRYLTYYDELTNLHNRRSLLENVDKQLTSAEGGGSRGVSVLYMNLDRFGQVNAQFGHDFGDRLLREAAGRLAHCIPLGALLARIGDDAFAVLLPDVGSPDDVPKIAAHIVEQFAKPLVVSGRELVVTASVGAASAPVDGSDARTLLAAAQQAMRAAKRRGGNRCAAGGDADGTAADGANADGAANAASAALAERHTGADADGAANAASAALAERHAGTDADGTANAASAALAGRHIGADAYNLDGSSRNKIGDLSEDRSDPAVAERYTVSPSAGSDPSDTRKRHKPGEADGPTSAAFAPGSAAGD
ncbi:GGDEF domain-containing protein [Paenibacillus athensensis]|uniref:PAS domain S-box-containing protein/diguanylate cyclase (GGDEF) domain-containing protein n=1 Tax=Paenibacillus athensensis TaxID=1967502 RepID=A0A4Y8Q1W6_9BACL|nr:sensor domain-containing diguanylate cyclase [Paenibacillus athensensis]MCD1261033.1 GGDEF domain-containing protein [Paenibacillus athensensis]